MKFDIAKKLAVTYIIILVATIVSGLFCFFVLMRNQDADYEMRFVTLPAIEKLKEIKSLFLEIKPLSNRYLFAPNKKDKERLREIIQKDYPAINDTFQQNIKQWKDKKEVAIIRKISENNDQIVQSLMHITRSIKSDDDYTDDLKMDRLIAEYDSIIVPKLAENKDVYDSIIQMKDQKLTFQQEEKARFLTYLAIIISTMLMVVVLVSLISIRYTRRDISNPLKHLKDVIVNVAQGEVNLINKSDRKDEIGEMQNAISEMVNGMISKINFSNSIGKGNYDTHFVPLSEKDELGHALINMSNNLKKTQEELRHHSEQLQASEEELKARQNELIKANSILEENVNDLRQARIALDLKAQELEEASSYKSEFLANMSHELRTPLNSVLILSKLLEDNKEKNLTPRQIEFASVIQKSGSDLLRLINEVLDLAKVESGKIDLEIDSHTPETLARDMEMTFKALSIEKDIEFVIELEPSLPQYIKTDLPRVEQIVKNLLSNAFKFTPNKGKIVLNLKKMPTKAFFTQKALMQSNEVLAISVTDTGIGIPKEKHNLVFVAFKQADGTTQRKYGGTGLGLSISRELANLLGGEITLDSELGKGSTFTIYLPVETKLAHQLSVEEATLKAKGILSQADLSTEGTIFGGKGKKYPQIIADDRDDFHETSKSILIIEDDLQFAKVLLDFARERGFKGIVINQGDLALPYIEAYKPQAIVLDMKLPVMDGWTILKKLKESEYAHIPVHIMSGMDKEGLGMELGASNYLIKPISPEKLDNVFNNISAELDKSVQTILVIEDDQKHNMVIKELVSRKGIIASSAYTGEQALSYLGENMPDLVILDLGLPDINGIELLKKIKNISANTPVVIFTGVDLSKSELAAINAFGNIPIVIKSESSYSRLLSEVEQFIYHINKVKAPIIDARLTQNIVSDTVPTKNLLKGKKVLIADDDNRNVFALKTILEQEGVICVMAANGIEAIEAVMTDPQIEAVLMDIMMPEMDGYEATKHIRALGKEKLPIIGLTAKAMKGDREECLAAGLSDYMSKPINVGQLIALLQVWLYKETENNSSTHSILA